MLVTQCDQCVILFKAMFLVFSHVTMIANLWKKAGIAQGWSTAFSPSPRAFVKGFCSPFVGIRTVPPPRAGAFTLIELLVIVAILAVLLALLFPALGTFREKGDAAKCAGNLKGLGAAIFLSAGDNNGRWVIQDNELYGTWHKTLRDRGYLSSDAASFCPSFNPKAYASHQTYGVTWNGFANAPDDQNVITTRPASGPREYYDIKLMNITKPSKFLLMADSFTTRFKSQYHIVQGHTGMDEIHLRHRGRANVLFADGHVEALNPEGLREIGWRQAFDAKGAITNF